MDDRKRREAGTKVRREVLGDAHVDRAKAHETDFNADFQDLITRYAWGEIWDRPGLSKKTRSLLTISMLVALNRNDELKLHLRAAFNNGVTREDIREVLLIPPFIAEFPPPILLSTLRQNFSRKEISDQQDSSVDRRPIQNFRHPRHPSQIQVRQKCLLDLLIHRNLFQHLIHRDIQQGVRHRQQPHQK